MSGRIVAKNITVAATGVPTGTTISTAITEAYPLVCLQVYVVSGVVATISAQLEASLDGANFFTLGSPITNIAGGLVTFQAQFPFPAVRANVTVLTGTSPVIGVIVGAGRYFQG